MARSYSYSIAQFRTEPGRDERLNIGLVVFHDTGLDVRTPKSLDKLRAISSAVDVNLVRDSLEDLIKLDDFVRSQGVTDLEKRMLALQNLTSIHLTKIGAIFSPSYAALDAHLDALLVRLVQPEPAVSRVINRKPTRLLSSVKAAFRQERVLARPDEGLSSHRLVTGYKVAEGLPADLLLKNGAMHIIQTVDAALDEGAFKRAIYDIAFSALVFEQARMSFGDGKTASRLIYQSSSMTERLVTPSLQAAEHQGAKLINWASRDDRTRFIIELSSLAEPLEGGKRKNPATVHASKQGKLNIN